MWRTASGIRSLGSFQGNRLTSAFGASMALSMATAYGWAGGIVRQHQNRRVASTDEIPCHGEHEVGVGLEHAGHECIDRWHRDLGPLGGQCRTPRLPEYAWVLRVAHLGPPAHRLRQHRRDHSIGRTLQEIPDERAADAEPHHHELVDPQMIHQGELVVGVGVPRPIDFNRAGGLAGRGVAEVRGDAAILSLELLDRVEGELPVKNAMVAFNPPPGRSISGKPDPASW